MLELLFIILSTITGITRDVDPGLSQSAQLRAESIVCASNDFWTHSGKPEGTAEILTCFSNSGDVAQKAADNWRNSASHWAVLINPYYTRIGCGAHVTGDSILFACHLAGGGSVPNTALPVREGLLTATGLLLVVLASAWRQRRAH